MRAPNSLERLKYDQLDPKKPGSMYDSLKLQDRDWNRSSSLLLIVGSYRNKTREQIPNFLKKTSKKEKINKNKMNKKKLARRGRWQGTDPTCSAMI